MIFGVELKDRSRAEKARGEKELRAKLSARGLDPAGYRFRLIQAWHVEEKRSMFYLDAIPLGMRVA